MLDGYRKCEPGIHWEFRIIDLKIATEGRCKWCAFFASRSFGEFAPNYLHYLQLEDF